MRKLIGLSFSFCVKQILEGLVPLEQVEKMRSGTLCITDEDWLAVTLSYSRSYWKDFNYREIAKVVTHLRSLPWEQPRRHFKPAPNLASHSYWEDAETGERMQFSKLMTVDEFRKEVGA